MYIQSNNGGEGAPLQLPRDYSGSAFSAPLEAQQEPQMPQEEAGAPPPFAQTPTDVPEDLPHDPPQEPSSNGAQAAFSPFSQGRGGALGKLPFLSAFLPPPRKKGGKRGEKEGGFLEGVELFDWILIGAALLLFFTDNTDDILPLLLLLLLWD